MDITKIPNKELYNDLLESRRDLALCEKAKEMGFDVDARIEGNKKIIAVIEAEYKRRDLLDMQNKLRNENPCLEDKYLEGER